jgi:mannose-6-phosphate isomerase-like protein (cupin superfamily)
MLNPKEIRLLSPDDKEALHLEAEGRVKPFKFEDPKDGKVKSFIPLSKSELQKVTVQIVNEGGENNLHYHTNSDTTWMVLSGSARFYGPGDVLIGEFGKHEGVFMPGGARYWFEKGAGDEPLELLQMVSYEQGVGKQPLRINLDQHKDWMKNEELKVYENSEA